MEGGEKERKGIGVTCVVGMGGNKEIRRGRGQKEEDEKEGEGIRCGGGE